MSLFVHCHINGFRPILQLKLYSLSYTDDNNNAIIDDTLQPNWQKKCKTALFPIIYSFQTQIKLALKKYTCFLFTCLIHLIYFQSLLMHCGLLNNFLGIVYPRCCPPLTGHTECSFECVTFSRAWIDRKIHSKG